MWNVFDSDSHRWGGHLIAFSGADNTDTRSYCLVPGVVDEITQGFSNSLPGGCSHEATLQKILDLGNFFCMSLPGSNWQVWHALH